MCPSCGGAILDEETLALIDDLEQTISSEVTLRDGTARKLATTLAFKYEISGFVKSRPKAQVMPPRKVIKQETVAEEEQDPEIINVSQIGEGLDAKTREQLFEQAVREKYNMVDQAAIVASEMDEPIEDEHAMMANVLSQLGNRDGDVSDSELDGNPRLEKERLMRLAKQQLAMKSGSGSVRRSG